MGAGEGFGLWASIGCNTNTINIARSPAIHGNRLSDLRANAK